MSESTLTSPSTIGALQTMLHELYALREWYTFPAFGSYSGYTGSNAKFNGDANGNLGYGVTPSAWGGAYAAGMLEFRNGGFVGGHNSASTMALGANLYFNGTNWV